MVIPARDIAQLARQEAGRPTLSIIASR
jgi:hypothetical protein